MSYAILAAVVWALAAAVCRASRPRDTVMLCALIASGVPITGWVVLSHGPWIGLVTLAVGAALLRWPAAALFGGLRGEGGKAPLGADGRLGASE